MAATTRVHDAAERSLKTAFRYLSSVNQSPLKLVFDPVYEAVARGLLRDVAPSEALM